MVLGKIVREDPETLDEFGDPIPASIDRNEFIKCLGEGLTECGLVLAKMNLMGRDRDNG